MNREQAHEIIASVLAAYPTHAERLGEAAVGGMDDTWPELLADLEYEAVAAAVVVHCRTSKWVPSIAELVDLATSGGVAVRPGEDAWGDFRALRNLPCGRAPRKSDLADPLVWRCIERLGWREWGETTSDAARASYRRAFIDLYNASAIAWRATVQAGPAALDALRQAALPDRTAAHLLGGVTAVLSATGDERRALKAGGR